MKPSQWRDAVRDSDLDSTAKLTAFVISTYMNGAGECWPSMELIAERSGKSVRTVFDAISRIESAGYIRVVRSKGRSSHRYIATTLKSTAGLTWQSTATLRDANPAILDGQPGNQAFPTRQPTAGESEKANESVAAARAPAWRPRRPLLENTCLKTDCETTFVTDDDTEVFCEQHRAPITEEAVA